ncbi:MAG: hypothetical protein CL398_05915 [Acidiferrobacteraceae bacterium]|nr:hypothetical protein [Acidiferrobacteraceae bacterium]|tara:strand:- start:1071 stop:2513 length:1443 start_codon:yes stop_codon:yes gene_type:complete
MTAVSIVVVNHNSGPLLKACITSVLASDISMEIIVVDNASVDDSATFLASLSSRHRLNVIYNEENLGFSKAINQGVRFSEGQYIVILNPDCLIYPHTVGSLLQILLQDPSSAIVGGLVFNFDGSEQQGCRRREPTILRSLRKALPFQFKRARPDAIDMKNEPLPSKEIYVDAVSGAFLIIRKSIFVDIGGMDERFFLHFEDLDLCHRVRTAGWRVIFSPDVSIFHYQGGSISTLNVSIEKHKSMYRYQRKHHAKSVLGHVLLYILIWVHFLAQSVLERLSDRSATNIDLDEVVNSMLALPQKATSSTHLKSSDVLVIGSINDYCLSVLDHANNAGWRIYAYSKGYTSNNDVSISWIPHEYLEKAPKSDLPKFNRIIINSSTQLNDTLRSWLRQSDTAKVAVIDAMNIYDPVLNDDGAVQQERRVCNADNRLDVLTELDQLGISSCQKFPLLRSQGKTVGAYHKEVDGLNSSKECFSWLSS